MPDTSARLWYVASVSRYQVHVQVMNSPASCLAVIDTNIKCVGMVFGVYDFFCLTS
jgi:hypothetical protein